MEIWELRQSSSITQNKIPVDLRPMLKVFFNKKGIS